MSAAARFDRGHTDDLMSFLAASPSPYHAVANTAERLEKAGFRQVAETDAWDGTTGGKYVLRGGAIVAWYVPEGAEPPTVDPARKKEDDSKKGKAAKGKGKGKKGR